MASWQKPYYETPDAKRLAAIRANPSGLPTRQVRPMLPNNYDATEKSKWGTSEYGQSQIPMDNYRENNRKMYTMEDVPETPRVGGWQAGGVGETLAIQSKYGAPGGVNNLGSFPAVNNYLAGQGSTPPATVPKPAMPLWGPSTEADAFSDPQAPSAMPNAWQTGALSSPVDASVPSALTNRPKAGQRWGTALDKVPVSVSARGPASRARQERLQYSGLDQRKTGYGGYQ